MYVSFAYLPPAARSDAIKDEPMPPPLAKKRGPGAGRKPKADQATTITAEPAPAAASATEPSPAPAPTHTPAPAPELMSDAGLIGPAEGVSATVAMPVAPQPITGGQKRRKGERRDSESGSIASGPSTPSKRPRSRAPSVDETGMRSTAGTYQVQRYEVGPWPRLFYQPYLKASK